VRGKNYTSEGIVLARKNYSEADRILAIYSNNFGKLVLIAKGVRKLKSKKRGSIEIFSRLKFSAARGKNFDILTETEIIDIYKTIRGDLKKVSLAYYYIELINKLTSGNEENIRLYNFLVNSLERLKSEKSLKVMKKEYIYNLLLILGYWPKGKKLINSESYIEEITERRISSARVGKKILS